MRMFQIVLAASASVCFLMPARASDWYVDAAIGNDANDGQTPASAWKTLTHAVLTVQPPTGGHTFHLAAGLYDAQNGEQYPLYVSDHMQIVGAGVDVTTLAGSASSLLVYQSTIGGAFSNPIETDTRASAMTLRDAAVGIALMSQWNPVQPSFTNLRFTALSNAAATLTVNSSFGSHTVAPSFTSIAIDSCAAGFVLHSAAGGSGAFADVEFSATDVQIAGCTGDAISSVSGTSGLQKGSSAYIDLVRCRVTQNAGSGVSLVGGSSLDAQSCLFAANTGSGVDASGGVTGAVALRNCTVANNGGIGLRGPTHAPMSIFGSILFGNATDIALVGPVSAMDSCSGDGSLVGQPGCIQADPAFVNPAIGDYRLRFASPCIETGDPGSNGELDLLGHVRPYDGDLDTHAGPDMGAFEFETLDRKSVV